MTNEHHLENIQDDLEPNLRELLLRKRKMKEIPNPELDNTPRYISVQTFDGRTIYKL